MRALIITGHPEKRGLAVATWVSWTPAGPSRSCPKDKDAADAVMPWDGGLVGSALSIAAETFCFFLLLFSKGKRLD